MFQADQDLLASVWRNVVVKDRKYRLKTYKNCFLGNVLINAVMKHANVSEEEALEIAKRWQTEKKWFSHVCDDHIIQNKGLFFHWQIANPKLQKLIVAVKDVNVLLKNMQIPTIAFYLTKGEHPVAIQDRIWRAKTYKECFKGNEAVDWISDRFLVDRQVATAIGEAIFKAGYFKHVSDSSRVFLDGEFFYTTRSSRESACCPWNAENVIHILTFCINSLRNCDFLTPASFTNSEWSEEIGKLVDLLSCCEDGLIPLHDLSFQSSDECLLYSGLFYQVLRQQRFKENALPDHWLSSFSVEDIKSDPSGTLASLKEDIGYFPFGIQNFYKSFFKVLQTSKQTNSSEFGMDKNRNSMGALLCPFLFFSLSDNNKELATGLFLLLTN